MELTKIIAQAEAEIALKHEEAEKYLAEAREQLETARRTNAEAQKRESEVVKFQKEVDKKIAKLEELEEIQRSEHDRAILKEEAEELMKKAQKMIEQAQDKVIEADAKMKVAEDRELKLKENAGNYKKKLKEAAISNLLDLMFKEV